MSHQRFLRQSLPTALLAAALLAPGAVVAEEWVQGRTPDGQPDLEGIWTTTTTTPLQRPEEFGERLIISYEEAVAVERAAQEREEALNAPTAADEGAPPVGGDVIGYNAFWLERGTNAAHIRGEYRSSLIVDPPDGRIPAYTDAARERMAQRMSRMRGAGAYDGPERRPLGERCIMSFGSSAGPPMLPSLYNNNYQIVQSPGHVLIVVEMVHDARIIRLDSEHLTDAVPKWMGDSVGRWEGDTLVVETVNFHPLQRFRGASENLKVIEKFTRTGPDEIKYEFTLEDPTTFVSSWTGQLPMRRSDQQMHEYACHEGNYALYGIFAGARQEERAAAANSDN